MSGSTILTLPPAGAADIPLLMFQSGYTPLSAEEIEQCVDAGRILQSQDIHAPRVIQPMAHKHGMPSGLGVLLVAISPSTGDSILHSVAAAGNEEGIFVVRQMFDTRHGWVNQVMCAVQYAVMTHQNHLGNTALHAAAAAGHLVVVKRLYRMFNRVFIADEGPDIEGGELHAEDWVRVGTGDELWADKALLFLSTENRAGRVASAEARHHGHEDIAVFLEAIIGRIDPEGLRYDADEMRRIEAEVRADESVPQSAFESHRRAMAARGLPPPAG